MLAMKSSMNNQSCIVVMAAYKMQRGGCASRADDAF